LKCRTLESVPIHTRHLFFIGTESLCFFRLALRIHLLKMRSLSVQHWLAMSRMNMFCIAVFIAVFLCFSSSVSAQRSLPDSLNSVARTVSADSAAKLYVQLARYFLAVNPDSVAFYAGKAMAIAPKQSVAIGDAYIQMGNYSHMRGLMDSAIFFYTKAQTFFKEINNEKGIGKVYQSFAVVKQSMKDYKGALDDNLKAIGIYEKIGFRKGLTMAYMGAGNCSKFLGNNSDGGLYIFKAMNNALALGDSVGYYQTMAEYAELKYRLREIDSSNYYYERAIPYLERNNFYYNLIPAYITYSDLLLLQEPVNEERVHHYLFSAKALATELDIKDNLQYIYSQMGAYYVLKQMPDSVFYYMKLSKSMADSISAARNVEILHETETRFETEKKDLQILNQSLEITAQERENAAQSRLLIIGGVGLLIVCVLAVLAFVNFKRSQRANVIIQQQKQHVEQQKYEIEHQKLLVEVKQKEIIDSIDYAKRIQSAILPPAKLIRSHLPESFVLYKPKDIVAGDFYWLEPIAAENGTTVLFAACDCTGHGVPGALVSVICHNGLNRAVREYGLREPGRILDKTREIVISEFEKSEEDVKDGMDVALCALNGHTLSYAGANNPLWIVRKGATEVEEYKATKQPIGKYHDPVPYTTHHLTLQSGDTVYIFSDGYSDQFGGEQGKKLKASNLKKRLLAMQHESMQRQCELLDETFSQWRSQLEQTDDVCVVGVRVT
jgi:serine phosphatase RsbU (regulator of sigma subunit)